jgi:hypothetical protein
MVAREKVYLLPFSRAFAFLSNAFEIVELLVHKTPEAEEEIYHYAKAVKVFELAVDGGS